MQSPMVCGHLRHLRLSMLNIYFLPLGPQNETGPTARTEIVKTNPSDVHLQMNALPPPQSPQPISQSHIPGDNNIKYLEQLLESSLATVAVIQISGNTLADVLTPRAYETFKALYALAALDAAALSTSGAAKSRGSGIPTHSIFSNIGNDCPFSSNHLPPLPNPRLGVPPSRTGRIHVHLSVSVDYVMLLSCVGLAAVSFLVVFSNFPRLCEIFIMK